MPDPREQLRRVRLCPEWHNQYPVRIEVPGHDVLRELPTEQLAERFGVPADIVAEIDAWDRQWQDTYRRDDPRQSGFVAEEPMNRWCDRGLRVARRLTSALGPAIRVEVVTQSGHCVVADNASNVSYFGSLPPGRTRDRPAGVIRRTIVDGHPVDEAFTRNLRWETTWALVKRRFRGSDWEYVEITKAEADAFIQRVTEKAG